ncbi:uncharacterized protein APUU_30448A [Aspergillus puulaauensis]|uniref:Uncharacterized protein n=1 Tax=Aspergillus puulaauensis TaxID=1220207 RepID=A0A7R8AM41_9EURO|nr:uncharacterized protein APUU_30448A [Aspergillus puulaauensis]BCS22223.1 hypothetical protein APUU_30448A [Aspergillus puulaauensis]
MAWSQVSATRWERALTGMEEYFVFIGDITAAQYDGRQQYTVCSKVKVDLNIPNPESALRHAWKQVRHEEPDIATTLEPGKKVYDVLNDAEIEENWLASTFIVDYTHDGEELYRLGRKSKPATLYYLPKSSELVLHAHHATIDGIGMIMFWHRFFRAVSSPNHNITFGAEHVRLAPSLDIVLPPGSGLDNPTPEQKEKGTALLMKYIHNLPAIGLPSKLGKVPAGACQAMEYIFDEHTTAALIRACKARGLTVTSAVHAAYIAILREYADPQESNTERYTSPTEFNLRGFLEQPYCGVAAANYYITFPFTMDLGKLPGDGGGGGFEETCAVLNRYYRSTLQENPEILELQGCFTRALEQCVKTPEYQQAPIPTDALVSSLGVVEKHLQRSYGDEEEVVVRDWKLACDVILGMSAFHIYTFRGTLRLVYQFNEAYQDPKDIRMYLEGVDRVLKRELLT